MKNIHVLPTDKPSRLYYFTANKEGYYLYPNNELVVPRNPNCTNQNIYITSDEEIKEGDLYIIEFNGTKITKCTSEQELISIEGRNDCQKIILTTDQDLIKDGVQAIDDEFIEWFVNNPSCEEVEVVDVRNLGVYGSYYPYKIIIPKEEPFKHECRVLSTEEVLANRSNAYEFIDFDKQETLEEVINKYPLINQRKASEVY